MTRDAARPDPRELSEIKDALGISFPSASAALARFEEMGILGIKQKQRRNRVFVAKEVIEILNRR